MLYVGVILKIWGSLLLIRIVLVLCLLVLLLILPFRYRLYVEGESCQGEVEEETDRLKKGRYQAQFYVKWFWSFLHAEANVLKPAEGKIDFSYFVNMLGETIFSSRQAEEVSEEDGLGDQTDHQETEDSSKTKDSDMKNSDMKNSDMKNSDEKNSDEEDSEVKDSAEKNADETGSAEEDLVEEDSVEKGPMSEQPEEESSESASDTKEDSDKEKKSKKKVIKGKKTLGDILYDLAVLRDKWEYLTDILSETESLEAISSLKSRIVKLLISILPRKMEGNLTIGTGQPDSTGIAYGVYCSLLFPKYHDIFTVIPEFEKMALDGEVQIDGHIRIGSLLVGAIGFILDSKIRLLYRKLMILKDKDMKDWDRELKRLHRQQKRKRTRSTKLKMKKNKK